MPRRNVDKIYISDQYYHVYNRAVNDQRMFMDDDDYNMFLTIMQRYLGQEAKDARGRIYASLQDSIELLAFCLMPDHYQLLVYLKDPSGLTDLLRKVGTTYAMYFNRRHGADYHLAQERFRATRVEDDYVTDILRHIHLQPVSHRTWEHSSHAYYAGQKQEDWLQTSHLLKKLGGHTQYSTFADNHEANAANFDSYKDQLAHH